MTPYRQETTSPNTQPVGFYKIIALTFLLLALVLLGIIIFTSSKRATITLETKPEPVDVSFSVGINMSDVVKIEGAVASTTVSLTKSYKPTATREVAGTANGQVLLHNETNADQVLIATTRVLTEDGVLFRLKNRVNVPAKGTILADYYPDKEGSKITKTGKLTIPGLNEEKQKVIYATVDNLTSGNRTVGYLSEKDLEKAKSDLKLELEKEGKKLLTANIDKPIVLAIAEEKYETPTKVGDEVENFNLEGTATVVGVMYNKEELDKMAKSELEKQLLSDSEILNSAGDSATISLSEYDLHKSSAKLNVFLDGSVLLNPESRGLQKDMFFGKSEAEVRRYLLSLDHISKVEIKFKPAWVRTVPSFADQVSVVVKNVE